MCAFSFYLFFSFLGERAVEFSGARTEGEIARVLGSILSTGDRLFLVLFLSVSLRELWLWAEKPRRS